MTSALTRCQRPYTNAFPTYNDGRQRSTTGRRRLSTVRKISNISLRCRRLIKFNIARLRKSQWNGSTDQEASPLFIRRVSLWWYFTLITESHPRRPTPTTFPTLTDRGTRSCRYFRRLPNSTYINIVPAISVTVGNMYTMEAMFTNGRLKR
jgi:hypothetical protein